MSQKTRSRPETFDDVVDWSVLPPADPDAERRRTSFTFALSEAARRFLDEHAALEGHADADAYVRWLVREERKRKAREKLEAMLMEGLNSGPPIEVTEEFWEQLRRDVAERSQDEAAVS